LIEGLRNIDHEVGNRLGAVANVAIPGVENYRGSDPTRLGLALFRIVVHEGMRDIDHVGYPADGVGYCDVIRMNARPSIGRKRRAKQIIGFEITDTLPKSSQEIIARKSGFSEGTAIRPGEAFELVPTEGCSGGLLFQPDASRFLRGSPVVA
jgi:hypothetical protein